MIRILAREGARADRARPAPVARARAARARAVRARAEAAAHRLVALQALVAAQASAATTTPIVRSTQRKGSAQRASTTCASPSSNPACAGPTRTAAGSPGDVSAHRFARAARIALPPTLPESARCLTSAAARATNVYRLPNRKQCAWLETARPRRSPASAGLTPIAGLPALALAPAFVHVVPCALAVDRWVRARSSPIDRSVTLERADSPRVSSMHRQRTGDRAADLTQVASIPHFSANFSTGTRVALASKARGTAHENRARW